MMSCHYIINMTASVVNMQEVDGIIYREKYVKCTGYLLQHNALAEEWYCVEHALLQVYYIASSYTLRS